MDVPEKDGKALGVRGAGIVETRVMQAGAARPQTPQLVEQHSPQWQWLIHVPLPPSGPKVAWRLLV